MIKTIISKILKLIKSKKEDTHVKNVFFSFHYENDLWRAVQIRYMGMIVGNVPFSNSDWEEVKKGGEQSIRKWVNEQLENRSCTIVLVGEKTSTRKLIEYEIKESWKRGMGVVGICIHNLEDANQKKSLKGNNPFENIEIDGKKLSDIVKLYDPPYENSKDVYNYIKENIEYWVEEAIEIRNNYK